MNTTAADRLDEGRYRVKVPLPFPLRWVNAYVLRGREGWTVIDPGLRTPEAETLWGETMREIGMDFADVERIVLTHYHPDHYGLAGWFQGQCRAEVPVFLSGEGHALADRLWGPGETLTRAFHDQFLRHGMDRETASKMIPHMDSFIAHVSPQPKVTHIEGGQQVRLGDREYLAMLTPGHAAGHLCFYEESSRELFCGDHVLPQITPNVTWIPGEDPNPLGTFLRSLEEVALLDVSIAFPGHRDPFLEFAERAREIIHHHEERLDAIAGMLVKPASAYEVCRRLFGERLSIHQLRFAMGETLAHLYYLSLGDRIAELEPRDDGVIAFVRR